MKHITLRISDEEWSNWRIAAFREAKTFSDWVISRIRTGVLTMSAAVPDDAETPKRRTPARVQQQESQSVEKALEKADKPANLKGLDVPIMAVSNSAEDVNAQLKRLQNANKEMKERGYGPKK